MREVVVVIVPGDGVQTVSVSGNSLQAVVDAVNSRWPLATGMTQGFCVNGVQVEPQDYHRTVVPDRGEVFVARSVKGG